jgi:histidinol dehydrogenase
MYWTIYENADEETIARISRRPDAAEADIQTAVDSILLNVKENGDKALVEYAAKFDGTDLSLGLYATEAEFEEAERNVSPSLKEAIETALKNIRAFHQAERCEGEVVETIPGCRCWRKIVPIEKVGLYIPGGTAPLFSTVLMLAVPAKIAGCKKIVLATPAKNGKIAAPVLYAARRAGVDKVLKCGGAQAIAAFSYGTESVEKVDKIFGPGNRFVALAKAAVSRRTAIDMVAGPSEVMVVADKMANPLFVATDLLSQAEHGRDSQVVLVVRSESIGEGRAILSAVDEALQKAFSVLPRHEFLIPSLESSSAVIVQSDDDVLRVANGYAPEHLILNTVNAEELLEGITSAGSVFLGQYSPESAGDYASGTNHTLPTSGWARSSGGVSLDSFIKKITCQRLTKEAAATLSPVVVEMAEAEGLASHALAMKVRTDA